MNVLIACEESQRVYTEFRKRGRLHFNNSKHAAPFPSMLVFMVNDCFMKKLRNGVIK